MIMTRGKKMKELDKLIADTEQQIEHLQIKLSGMLEARRAMSGEPEPVKQRTPRANVKQRVLDLLQEVRHSGLNAAMAVQMAKERGETLDRGSVSSLLSRLKNEGTVTYDGVVYKLAEREGQASAGPESPAASLH